MSSSRFAANTPHSSNPQEELKENGFELETSLPSLNLPPPRTPLIAIPDPAQHLKDALHSDSDSDSKDNIESVPTKKSEAHPTSKVFNRNGKPSSEPNSAQTTPARSGSRFSPGGGHASGPRTTQSSKGKEVSLYNPRVSRCNLVANPEFSVGAPHFELSEDPSYWEDHNVQVLIRVRPLNAMERASQGYNRCLRQESDQTLVWLGHPETRFTFDHVAGETISQEKLFRVAGVPMVENCFSGYNSCMFAYGQTGSGKTHTMMGEINQVESMLSQDCGITPRIFEFLFSRIRMEEESRRDEKLMFSCKCSFLEIYNEQIIDLLVPSSTNLQLREDSHKGVYVENLTEYNVRTVNDVIKLLLQGATNRKMEATYMNSESSCSHSVFTCVIESWWEKDSMTHFRFARLNLVDLAGSERQKSSGAEGDRLKEVANINKSLSTLGLVIMSLVDLAHGKHRHVPYRDSRLTFLLQDSLGGNSKTTVIANVSPSLCSANETLSTLKFAQRAKLIQNSAIVNEDASGDVGELQQQIKQLKLSISQREEDLQHSKIMLSLREDKIKELELMGGGFSPADHYLMAENKALKQEIQLLQAMIGRNQPDDLAFQNKNQYLDCTLVIQSGNVLKELEDAILLIEQMKSEKIQLIEELELQKKQNERYMEILNKEEYHERQCMIEIGNAHLELNDFKKQDDTSVAEHLEGINSKALQARLDKLAKDLEEARLHKCQYEEDQASWLSQRHQVELVCEQVEVETTKTILHLQEEFTALQVELNDRLNCMIQENMRLQTTVAGKEEEIKALCGEWESATLELTSFLVEGSKSLKDASGQVESIVSSFPSQINSFISEHVERAARTCIDKEETILLLEKGLEDAQKMVMEMELKLNCLREATVVLNQSGENDSIDDAIYLSMLFNEKINMVKLLESKLKFKEDLANEAEKRADAAFLVVKWLTDCHKFSRSNCLEKGIDVSKVLSPTEIQSPKTSEVKVNANAEIVDDCEGKRQLESLILECENAIKASYKDVEEHIALLHTDIVDASTSFTKLVLNSAEDIQEMRTNFMEIKENQMGLQSSIVKLQTMEPLKFLKGEIPLRILHEIRDEVVKMNDRIIILNNHTFTEMGPHGCPLTGNCQAEADGLSVDSASTYSTSVYESSPESIVFESKLDVISYSCSSKFSGERIDKNTKSHKGSVIEPEIEDSDMPLRISHPNEATALRKELGMAFDAFNKLYIHLVSIINENCMMHGPFHEDMKELAPSSGLTMEVASTCFNNTRKRAIFPNVQLPADDKVNPAAFLSKCEEARATMKEADYMLNALLKANQNEKQLNGVWKQVSEKLMVERSHLIEENEQLKSSICSKERENKLLLDEFNHDLVELAKSISLLEGCFQQIQREVEEKYKILHSEVLSLGKEMLHFFRNSQSSVEEVFSMIMENGLSLYVVHQCLVGELAQKIPSFSVKPGFCPFEQKKWHQRRNDSHKVSLSSQDNVILTNQNGMKEEDEVELFTSLEEGELDPSHDNMTYENMALNKNLERREVLLKGLLFDFSLLQETISNRMDAKHETEKLIVGLSEVRQELELRTSQPDDILIKHRESEGLLMDTQNALFVSNSSLEQARETIDTLSDQNAELRTLLKDFYLKKSETEVKLEEQQEMIKNLEREIIHLTSSAERKEHSTHDRLEEDLFKVSSERDQLREEIFSLNEKLEMTFAFADENAAIAVEARQESEASKIYAEQKEEEVKILEHSVEELECTINVLEKKVYEMGEQVEGHRLIRDSLETKLRSLRVRFSAVENITDVMDSEDTNDAQSEDHISRQLHSRLLELHDSHNQIQLLQNDIAERDKEIKQYKDHIKELLLHSEAQASQYQQKYKALEVRIREVKTKLPDSALVAPILDKSEKLSGRPRGSSSPFRCIASLVPQRNLEKDQELSVARLRIEELEALLASGQKEVCLLNSRLAAAESMTHDVIRDLLGVKLDMMNYANLIDQYQVQKIVEEAYHQAEESHAKEQEIQKLREQIIDLTEERESCISEINKKEADILGAEVTIEQLQERDQLLSAQNEMLKVDKSNLLKRVAEKDEMVKTILGTRSTQRVQQTSKNKGKGSLKIGDDNLTKGVENSEKLRFYVNDELAHYRKSSNQNGKVKTAHHVSAPGNRAHTSACA